MVHLREWRSREVSSERSSCSESSVSVEVAEGAQAGLPMPRLDLRRDLDFRRGFGAGWLG
jgi:hypothetical protein